ncbi:septation protein SepH [Pseudonocardia nematodicida]|uniref:Septation protein SepH n=1 Tax=Pseudonocardia nematodicida TaxID=1206997 RepID=A0ABV1KJC0_9PSEU
MRALRVVGVTGDGSVILEDPGRRERYTVPADEQLRAAARGDVTRLGQIAIELESQLRPREIQARIRGGASVDEVAAAAGVPTQKIERFAYPVLLERTRTAELAQGAHPQRADGPDTRTLGETVAHTFGLRGQDHTGAGWDSWRGEDGRWVVVLTWQTGRSDNAAHWAFQPGAHGGTVVPLDENASDLVEGLPARPLRPLGAVVDMARDDDQTPTHSGPSTEAPARAVAGGQAALPADSWAGRGIAPEQRRASPPAVRHRVEAPTRSMPSRTEETRAPAAAAPAVPRTGPAAREGNDEQAADVTTGPAAHGKPASGSATDETPDAGATAGTAAPAPTSADARTAADRPSVDGSAERDDATATPEPTPSAGPAADRSAERGDATADAPATPDPAPAAGSGDPAAAVVPAAESTPDATPRETPPEVGSGVTGSGSAASESTESVPAAPEPAAPNLASANPTPPEPAAPDAVAASSEVPPPATANTAASDPATPDPTPASIDEDSTPDDTTADTPPAATGSESPDPGPASTPDSAGTGTEEPAPRPRSTASRRTKKGKPVMPSWDEVLLGVRGQR